MESARQTRSRAPALRLFRVRQDLRDKTIKDKIIRRDQKTGDWDMILPPANSRGQAPGQPKSKYPLPARVVRGIDRQLDFQKKILLLENVASWRASLRAQGRRLVVTNGCFDLLHVGHVTYLEAARNQGDALLVGVNGDAAVRLLKGPGRPVNSEQDRASVIAALEAVDAVSIFRDRRATNFLSRAKPDIYVKGGDYTLETLDQEERAVVGSAGGRIVFIPFVPAKSTTGLIERILSL